MKMNQEYMNANIAQMEDREMEKISGGYISTDHYTTTQLSSPITCNVCGGMIYSITANNYGPQRVLKSVTYHCSGNGTHAPHDIVNYYM